MIHLINQFFSFRYHRPQPPPESSSVERRNTCPKFDKKFTMKELKLRNSALSESASSNALKDFYHFCTNVMNFITCLFIQIQTKRSVVHLQIQKGFEQRRRGGIPGTMQD